MKFENVVVGNTLSALMYSYIHNFPVVFTKAEMPRRFDYLTHGIFPLLIPEHNHSLKTFNERVVVGPSKQLLWDRLYFSLSLNGLVPVSNLCRNIRFDGEKAICSNEYSKICEIKFDTCHYFGDHNAKGFIREKKLDDDSYICYDYIAFNSGGKHDIDFINTSDNFVSKIWFYGSDRIDGNTPIRDACAVSKLTGKQLLDFDYSETMARFKVLKIMKDNGMRGRQSGYTKKGTPRHYDFRTTSIRRETSRIRGKITATSTNIQIKTNSEESMFGLLQNADNPCSTILEALHVSTP